MKRIFLIFSILTLNFVGAQVHNRMFKLNVGYSREQIVLSRLVGTFNDTSSTGLMNLKTTLPVVTFSEDFAINSRFSVSGTLGYQYFDLDYNNVNIGTNLFFASVNPQLSIFYRPGFEYYMKFKVGGIYRTGNWDDLEYNIIDFLPDRWGFFTGVTLAGINLFIHDHWGLNAEFSVWSPERVNVGVSYRFFKGTIPEGVPLDEYYFE